MTTPNTDALLPCPFCGGDVIIKQSHIACESPWIEHVGKACGVAFEGFYVDGDLREAWNTRTPSVTSEELMKTLVDADAEWFRKSMRGLTVLDPSQYVAQAILTAFHVTKKE